MDRGEADNMNADRREMTDTCLIVSGGPTDRKFAAEFVKNRKYPYVIAVDAGLAVCEELGLGMSISRRRMRRTRILRSARHSGQDFIPPMFWGPQGAGWIMSFPISI